MESSSTLEIDLSALDANLAAWRKVLGSGCEVCPVVKADAYGLGAVPVVRRLAASGVRMVAVYSMQQATEIVAAGLSIEMLVLMPVESLSRSDLLYRSMVSGKLHLTVHSGEQLEKIEAIGTTFGVKMPVHIEVDTGMCRLGMSIDQADRLLRELFRRKYVKLAGIFSHAAAPGCDVEFTDQQFGKFEELLARHADALKGVTIHFAGTCAAYRDTRYHRAMVRLGLGLFGYGDRAEEGIPSIDPAPQVRPVMRWVSRVVHTREVEAGTSVGYQRSFIAKKPMRIGVVPVGHADGYPVALSSKGVVRVGASMKAAGVIGQVNMDQVMVDITGLPVEEDVGTEVEIYSADPEAPNALPKMAKLAGTNCYELLCRLSPRVQRRYVVHDRQTGRVGHVATV